MEQKRRLKIVVIAIAIFVVLFGVFLFLISLGIQSSAVSVASINKSAPSLTPTPFQPNGNNLPGAGHSLSTAVLPAQAAATATATAAVTAVAATPAPTGTPIPAAPQIIQPQSEGTAYPLYIVREGDQLESLAQSLNLSPETIRNANFMFGDAITPGQALIIPPADSFPAPVWRFANLDKDMGDVFYPISFVTNRYRMHYMASTYPSVDPNAVAAMLDKGIHFIESTFGRPLNFDFDVYAVGTLFEQPNTYLLGRSFSLDRKIFILYNGGGDAVNQQYLATHELTHLYAWNTFKQPVSFLVSEGAAVYTGMKMISDSHYMPIKTFCAIYKREGRLPFLAEKTELGDFRGHNNNLVNYYSSGCFVGYLVETYGPDLFGQVYGTNDYEGVYGKPLEQLEQEWKDTIAIDGAVTELDTRRFVESVDVFMATNEGFFYNFNGSQQSIQAYETLDKARLALLSGNLDAFDQKIADFHAVWGR